MNRQTEVLVVGAGPVGLALAAELRRLGVPALIVDRHREPAQESRACVIHARTLEVLEPLGVTPELLSAGVKVTVYTGACVTQAVLPARSIRFVLKLIPIGDSHELRNGP